jgi:hypothetical protein
MNIVTPTLTAVSAALILAPTATADPAVPITPNDQQLLRGMAQMGVTATPFDMISEGHWICSSLDQGDGVNDLDSKIKADNPQFSQRQVNALIGFSVAAYCEGESGKLGN